MSKLTTHIILGFTLVLLFSASAFAQTSHSVWSDKPLFVRDGATQKEYKDLKQGDAIFA